MNLLEQLTLQLESLISTCVIYHYRLTILDHPAAQIVVQAVLSDRLATVDFPDKSLKMVMVLLTQQRDETFKQQSGLSLGNNRICMDRAVSNSFSYSRSCFSSS